MRRLIVLLSLTALAAAGAAGAATGLPVAQLLHVAAGLAGAQPRPHVTVAVVSPATVRAAATRQLDAAYPVARQDYDATLYRALGLLAPAQALHPLVVSAVVDPHAPVYLPGPRRLLVPRGKDEAGAALQGLIRAIYTDRYGLPAQPRSPGLGRDEALAAAATADGATELALHDLRTTAAVVPRSSLAAAFLAIESQFMTDVGLRLATNLYNVGGRQAVQTLLRRPPVSTEQALHVDKYLQKEKPLPMELPADAAGMTLVRDDTFGELDVRALLAVFQVPRLDRVGAGWGGGLSALYRAADGTQAVALRLDWDTPLDAAEWTEAAALYVNEAFDASVPGPPATTPCSADTCWSVGGRSIAYVANGTHTALVFGPSIDPAAQLARALAA